MDPADLPGAFLQARDHVGGGFASLLHRLKVNLDTPAIQRSVDSIRADEGRECFDSRIFQDLAADLALPLCHRRERNRFRRLRDSLNNSRVLRWEKAFGNLDVLQDAEQDDGDGYKKRWRLTSQDPLETAPVGINRSFEPTLGSPVEPVLSLH